MNNLTNKDFLEQRLNSNVRKTPEYNSGEASAFI